MTGPVVGTAMPSAGRYSVCARSPLTGLWGESNSGGFFGPELRFSGYDGIIITGKSAQPCWLSIIDGTATLHQATTLWGMDSYRTQSKVRELMNQPKARVACIGLAGEKQANMAAVMNDHGRAAGRTGMGAVMGSKGLKAIGVRGKNAVPIHNSEKLKQVTKQILGNLDDDMAAMSIRLAGTAGYVDMSIMYGDSPIRYYQQGEWEPASNLSGVLMVEEFQNRNRACYRCPIACGRETRAPRYGVERVDGPEYETVVSFGSLMMVDDLESVIYAGHLCNVYGLDTISTGATIALACELFERGILTKAQTGGLDIRYGDVSTVHQLIKMMAGRDGFGDLLADGSDALAQHYGVEDLAVTVNGLEVPMHDPRAFSGLGVIYAMSPRGACHMQGDIYSLDTGIGVDEALGLVPGDRFDDSKEKGKVAARQQAWRNLYNALTLCQFMNPGGDAVASVLESITGWVCSDQDLLMTGKRILTLKRILNHRLGWSRESEHLPELLLEPLEGETDSHVPNLTQLLEGSYEELGWNLETGLPSTETIKSQKLYL